MLTLNIQTTSVKNEQTNKTQIRLPVLHREMVLSNEKVNWNLFGPLNSVAAGDTIGIINI